MPRWDVEKPWFVTSEPRDFRPAVPSPPVFFASKTLPRGAHVDPPGEPSPGWAQCLAWSQCLVTSGSSYWDQGQPINLGTPGVTHTP